MSISALSDTTANVDDPHVLQSDLDPATRWKRLMTIQSPPGEHVYLAPSLTRTPTPPLLLDKSKDSHNTSQPSAAHRYATEPSSSSDGYISSSFPSKATVRSLLHTTSSDVLRVPFDTVSEMENDAANDISASFRCQPLLTSPFVPQSLFLGLV